MKEPDWKDCTEEDVWQFVAWHLAKNGIETILVGGAVAAKFPFNQSKVKEWCKSEGRPETFEELMKKIKNV